MDKSRFVTSNHEPRRCGEVTKFICVFSLVMLLDGRGDIGISVFMHLNARKVCSGCLLLGCWLESSYKQEELSALIFIYLRFWCMEFGGDVGTHFLTIEEMHHGHCVGQLRVFLADRKEFNSWVIVSLRLRSSGICCRGYYYGFKVYGPDLGCLWWLSLRSRSTWSILLSWMDKSRLVSSNHETRRCGEVTKFICVFSLVMLLDGREHIGISVFMHLNARKVCSGCLLLGCWLESSYKQEELGALIFIYLRFWCIEFGDWSAYICGSVSLVSCGLIGFAKSVLLVLTISGDVDVADLSLALPIFRYVLLLNQMKATGDSCGESAVDVPMHYEFKSFFDTQAHVARLHGLGEKVKH
ncbi:hypothetical protein F2Q69_00052433 [Brassica cretica]|uniref:Uncharacterized protein n=1 Tax=Brassica cretica TaxID=69181 RepID=A0A8S9N3T5_BRACR|nr:hypothetical protein F2Q69_00052433 [Brassica cretica]